MKTFGIEELNGVMMFQQETNTVSYTIKDIEEPITKKMLKHIKTQIGNFTLITNAGVDVHSSEVKNEKWNGITILRFKK